MVESKAVAVLTAAPGKSTDRRAAAVTKVITEGLGQLGGALRNLMSGIEIFEESGAPIVIPRQTDLPVHSIVLLSEMYFAVYWKAVARQVVKLSQDVSYRSLFHVFDLQELSSLTAKSKGSRHFSELLIARWLQVEDTGTAYGRARIPVRFLFYMDRKGRKKRRRLGR